MLPSDVDLVLSDFSGGTSYFNKVMKGMRYRLLLDNNILLKKGIQYEEKINGGFDLLTFIMAADTTITIQFY